MVWYCKSRLQEHQPSGIPSRLPASGILQNSTDWTSWQHLSCSNYQALSNGEQRTLQAEGIGGCHGDWRNVFFFASTTPGDLFWKIKHLLSSLELEFLQSSLIISSYLISSYFGIKSCHVKELCLCVCLHFSSPKSWNDPGIPTAESW